MPSLDNLLQDLNKPQLDAVTSNNPQRLVIAGPGAGKTKCLITAIAYAVLRQETPPENICAITFTNKAADEVKQRLLGILTAEQLNKMQLSTFHSMGLKILREYPQEANLRPGFSIYDADDSASLAKKTITAFYASREDLDRQPLVSASQLLYFISCQKNEMEMPPDILDNPDISLLYKEYNEQLVMANAVDFDDLLRLPKILFQQKPEILEIYQQRWPSFFVDEYQDTNTVQYDLVKMMTEKHKNIFVVGDDDQSIFSWRGANFHNILNFTNDFPDCDVFILNQNYRSNQGLVDLAQDFIRNNTLRKEKKLWSNNKNYMPSEFLVGKNDDHEAQLVVEEIKKLTKKQYAYEDVVVLYRTNRQSRYFEYQLNKNKVPYKIVGGLEFFQRKEIKDVMAYLRLMQNGCDKISFYRVMGTPTKGVGEKTIQAIVTYAQDNGLDYLDTIDSDNDFFKSLDKKQQTSLLKLTEQYWQWQKDATHLSLAQLIQNIIIQTGYQNWLDALNPEEREMRQGNVEELLSLASNYTNTANADLTQFLSDASLNASQSKTSDEGVVTLMSMHRAKGLEYKIVFCTGVEEDILPHFRSKDKESLEEERRLFYVAITRAKDKLYVTRAKTRRRFNQRVNYSSQKPSQFISELKSDLFLPPPHQIQHSGNI